MSKRMRELNSAVQYLDTAGKWKDAGIITCGVAAVVVLTAASMLPSILAFAVGVAIGAALPIWRR